MIDGAEKVRPVLMPRRGGPLLLLSDGCWQRKDYQKILEIAPAIPMPGFPGNILLVEMEKIF